MNIVASSIRAVAENHHFLERKRIKNIYLFLEKRWRPIQTQRISRKISGRRRRIKKFSSSLLTFLAYLEIIKTRKVTSL